MEKVFVKNATSQQRSAFRRHVNQSAARKSNRQKSVNRKMADKSENAAQPRSATRRHGNQSAVRKANLPSAPRNLAYRSKNAARNTAPRKTAPRKSAIEQQPE